MPVEPAHGRCGPSARAMRIGGSTAVRRAQSSGRSSSHLDRYTGSPCLIDPPSRSRIGATDSCSAWPAAVEKHRAPRAGLRARRSGPHAQRAVKATSRGPASASAGTGRRGRHTTCSARWIPHDRATGGRHLPGCRPPPHDPVEPARPGRRVCSADRTWDPVSARRPEAPADEVNRCAPAQTRAPYRRSTVRAVGLCSVRGSARDGVGAGRARGDVRRDRA